MICFTEGTLLRTPDGDRAVEALGPGDRVLTRDDGAQEVLWVGNRHLTGARLLVAPELRPIRIRARALDADLPDADLLVSPQHRILIRGRSARALFNTDEVLVAAADLINDRTITVARALRALTYYHLLLARHQVVWANGVPRKASTRRKCRWRGSRPASANGSADVPRSSRRPVPLRRPGATDADPRRSRDPAPRPAPGL